MRPVPQSSKRRSAAAGFTLVEMMVVVGLLSVLAALAVPSFESLVRDHRVRAGASAVQQSLWFARSEALKRNRRVSFTISSLEAGWDVVLSDANGTVLRQQAGVPGLVMQGEGSQTTFQYGADGRLFPARPRMEIADTSGRHRNCLSIDSAGRARVTKGACP